MPISLRPDLAGLVPYDPDMRPARVVLTANENNWGLPADVRAEVDRALAGVQTNRYPQATSPDLRELLGELWGLPARDVVVGNGGDEIIFNILLAFAGPGRALVNVPPTFSAYALYAQLTQTPLVQVPRTQAYDLDEGALLAAAPQAGVVVICSPNNPTGNVTTPAFVRRLAQAAPETLIMVDEAYGEFADPAVSCVPLVRELDNVCVLRTLSKAYSLAGARLGYLLAPDAVADGMLAVRLPYSVNRFSQAAATVVLKRREEVLEGARAIVRERARLAEGLAQLAQRLGEAGRGTLTVYPSQANYLLIRIEPAAGTDTPGAHDLHELLAARGILVRDFSSTPGCTGGLRITVGKPEEDDEFLAALTQELGIAGTWTCGDETKEV